MPRPAATAEADAPIALPPGAACIEMEAVRAAQRRCRGPQMAGEWPAGPLIACPRSKERVCTAHAAAVEARCDAAAAPAGSPQPPPLDWGAVAFGVATYNAPHEAALMQAAADTWLRRVRPLVPTAATGVLRTAARRGPHSPPRAAPKLRTTARLGPPQR